MVHLNKVDSTMEEMAMGDISILSLSCHSQIYMEGTLRCGDTSVSTSSTYIVCLII